LCDSPSAQDNKTIALIVIEAYSRFMLAAALPFSASELKIMGPGLQKAIATQLKTHTTPAGRNRFWNEMSGYRDRSVAAETAAPIARTTTAAPRTTTAKQKTRGAGSSS
jgi:hypothetical protein